jgi:hypothetical protein
MTKPVLVMGYNQPEWACKWDIFSCDPGHIQ